LPHKPQKQIKKFKNILLSGWHLQAEGLWVLGPMHPQASLEGATQNKHIS
jgi:hypothetical protein